MSELINGTAPEVIKCAMEHCTRRKGRMKCNPFCPYFHVEQCWLEVMRDAIALIERLEAQVPRWISVEERQPSAFVSVMVHMTDAGDFPAVREGFRVSDNVYLVPALAETHPVDYWMEMPEMEGAK